MHDITNKIMMILSESPIKNLEITDLKIMKRMQMLMKKGVPSFLKILKICIKTEEHREFFEAEILEQQECLEELHIENLSVRVFNFKQNNCQLKKITFRNLTFLNRSGFINFTKFLKLQGALQVLELQIGREEWRKNDYQGILTHLFKLPTLKKLIVGCEFPGIFEKLDVTNEAVDALAIMNSSKADQKSLERKFPNATITYQLD